MKKGGCRGESLGERTTPLCECLTRVTCAEVAAIEKEQLWREGTVQEIFRRSRSRELLSESRFPKMTHAGEEA